MYFNSLDFAVFLPLVFVLYWFVTAKHLKWQNAFLVVASYVFYGWWDARFLFLIVFSSLLDYIVGLQLAEAQDAFKRKIILWVSISANLGILCYFKYYNFFVDAFVDSFTLFGETINPQTLDIILPVGISFYTFQTLSYSIDVYRRQLEPTKDLVSFLAFVSFFPQLVAGPIERASHLLPQFYKPRVFHYSKAIDGCKQILWGLFKKIVIADTCALYVNQIFADYEHYSGSTLVLGAVFFAFQIYGDFSGYSDIAIGTSRLFGFDLKQNFAFPYFSRNIGEFWRRWHISLTTWFRDYVYIPLGGSRGSRWMQIRNVFIIFIVSGFWHGANWTFIIWGLINAIFFIPLLLAKRHRAHLDVVARERLFPNFTELLSMVGTFFITTLGWIFFRADHVSQALHYISGIFNQSLLTIPTVRPSNLMALILFFLVVEWLGRRQWYALETLFSNRSRGFRWGFYMVILVLIFVFNSPIEQAFIYFQF